MLRINVYVAIMKINFHVQSGRPEAPPNSVENRCIWGPAKLAENPESPQGLAHQKIR